MAVATAGMETCELCSRRFDATIKGRIGHLRTRHRLYARGVLFRVISPLVLLLNLWALGATHASAMSYGVAIALSMGLLYFGKSLSRAERTKAGATASIGFARFAKEGGLVFVLVPVILAALFLLVR